MATLGRAFISVHADTDPFARELRQQMNRLSDDLKQDTDRAGTQIGERLGTKVREGLQDTVRRGRVSVDTDVDLSPASVARTEVALRAVTRDREVDVTVNRRRLVSNLGLVGQLIGQFVLATVRILGDFFNFGRQIGQIFGEAFGNLSRSLGGVAAAGPSVAAALVQLAAAVVALTFVITLLIGALSTLLAILVAVVGTAQLFLTVLPGLSAGAVFALAPLILIFTNLGDAIKATTKDADTFEAAIEDFGDNTRAALTSLRGLVQFFLGIREAMQEAFFAPINEAIENLDTNLGPTFRSGFLQMAEAAGQFAANFISLFDHPQAIPFFNALFDLAELGFEEIGDAALNLLGAFANLIDESIPNVRRGVDGIAGVINGWADSINEFADDPNFQETLQGWEESFARLRDLGGEILDFAGNLIAGFEEDGIPVLERVTRIFEDINEFLTSEDAEEFFDGLRFAAIIFLSVLQGLIITLGFFVSLLGSVEDLITGNIKEGVQDIADLMGGFAPPIVVFLDMLFSIEGAWNRILFVIQLISGPVLGVLLSKIDDWGGLVEAIKVEYQRIRDWINRIIDRVGELFGGSRAVQVVVQGIRSFAQGVRTAFAGAVGFAQNLLAPLGGARDIASRLAGFAGSVRSALSAAVGFAIRLRDIAATIVFPAIPGGGIFGSFFGAEGGIFSRPTNMIIGEAGAEALIPLTRPARAMDLLEASGLAGMVRGGDGAGITFMPEVRVFIGSQELKGMVRVEVNNTNRQLKRSSLAGSGAAR